MTIQKQTVFLCDRCGASTQVDFVIEDKALAIDWTRLVFSGLHPNPSNERLSWDLCPVCTTEIFTFLKDKPQRCTHEGIGLPGCPICEPNVSVTVSAIDTDLAHRVAVRMQDDSIVQVQI